MDAALAAAKNDDTGEGPWALPEGWAWAKVGDLAMGGDGSVEPSKTPDIPFVLYSVPAFEAGMPDIVKGSDVESNKQFVPFNALLVCKINPRINRVWKVKPHSAREGRVIASTEWIVVRETPGVDTDYLRLFLTTERVRQYLASNVSGVGGSLMRVNANTVGAIEFPLAPYAEQRRVVAQVDALFAEIAEAEAALAAARKGLDTFRRALLKAAVAGELTKDWREANPASATSHDILERLRKLYPNASPTRDGWKPKSSLPPLPVGWTWCAIEEAGEVQLGRQRAPQHHDGENMRPYLRVANVHEDRLDLSDVKWMNFTPTEFKTFELRRGDILLNEGQAPDLLGRPAMYRGEIVDCCFQKTLLRFRAKEGVLPDFALIVFRYYMRSGRFKRESRITTNIGHLTQIRFVVMEFPLPSESEQQAIVESFRNAEAAVTDVLTLLDAEAADTARLKQSILKAAFEGRLVAQNPADEPASALLARLAANPPAANAKRGRGRKSDA